jgi:LmbE family N-acetylglucosaminyl deacetylase
MKILIIVAHPDDEVLGMGGTIKKLTNAKHNVKVVFMATGIMSRRSSDYKNKPHYSSNENIQKSMNEQIIKLKKDATKANNLLGVKDIEFLDFPDNEMDLVSQLEITKKVEGIICKFNPDIVYTHSKHDVNIDHRIIYESVITATRPMINSKIKKVLSFEVPSSTEWYFPSNFSPNLFVDISDELKIKLKAMASYKDELRDFPHPRSLEALEAIAKRWGSVSGFFASEAFILVRELVKKV